MSSPSLPERMPTPPAAGEWVRWRDPRHAETQWWDTTCGPGPFEVVRVLDHLPEGLPVGVVLKTRRGEREVSEVWLARAEQGPRRKEGVVSDPDWSTARPLTRATERRHGPRTGTVSDPDAFPRDQDRR
jgi:hypothetical protein